MFEVLTVVITHTHCNTNVKLVFQAETMALTYRSTWRWSPGERLASTDMPRLTKGVRSKKCVIRRFRRCAKDIECTDTNLDSTV